MMTRIAPRLLALAFFVGLVGCRTAQNYQSPIVTSVLENTPSLPYVLLDLNVDTPSTGQQGVFASATYAPKGLSPNTVYAGQVCRSEQAEALVKNTVRNIARKSDGVMPISEFREIRSGMIPLSRGKIVGKASCYANAIGEDGSREGVAWGIFSDTENRVHVLILVVPSYTGEQIAAIERQKGGSSISVAEMDATVIATLRTMTSPTSDKIEIFSPSGRKSKLPSCTSPRVIKALETALNQLYPGAGPYGPSMFQIARITNPSQIILPTLPPVDAVTCVALVTTENGADADLMERESYGTMNASHITNQTNILAYTYGYNGEKGELQTDFQGIRKSAPFHE